MKSDRVSTLQDIFKYQDFDAVEFSSWSKTADGRRKQVEVVKSLLPDDVQNRIIEIDTEIVQIKETRTIDNREIKIYDGQIKAKKKEISTEDLKVYASPVDVRTLQERSKQLVALQVQYNGVKTRYAERQAEYENMPTKEKELEKLFVDKETALATEEDELRAEFDRKLKAIDDKRKENAKNAETELTKLKTRKDEIVKQQQKSQHLYPRGRD